MTHGPIDVFLEQLDQRLTQGALEYGDRSFARPVAATEREIEQEALDLVGWIYVLWCQAARKTDMVKDQKTLRPTFIDAVRHRLRRNDRRDVHEAAYGSARGAMVELEVLAMDCFEFGQQLQRRLSPIARAIEVAQVTQPYEYRGRRGGRGPSRSSD